MLQLGDPSCPNAARGGDEHQPACDEHKKLVQMGSHPFWRTWNNSPPVLCDRCGTPLRLQGFEPL